MAEPKSSQPGGTSTGSATSTGGRTATDSTKAQRSADTSSTSGSQQSGGVLDRVKESATAQLTSQKDRGTDVLGSLAQAVRSSTEKLREQHHDVAAGYVEHAADQIDGWSRRLKEKDVEELLGDVQRLARRQPAVFIGSAFALGLVGARFLKSSSPDSERTWNSGGDARRRQYSATTGMSTAYDRGTSGVRGSADVSTEAGTAGIADVRASTSSATTAASAGSGRNRASSSRTENP